VKGAEGALVLDNIQSIDPVVGRALSKHMNLTLGGLTELTPEAAKELAQLRGQLELGGQALRALAPEVAAALSTGAYTLAIRDLSHLPPGVAAALAEHDGTLILRGRFNLPDESADAMAAHRGELRLVGLLPATLSGSQSLSKHQGNIAVALPVSISVDEFSRVLEIADVELTPSPNPDPGLVRESSCPWWGWKGLRI
jgi:hypothetical protein